MLIRNVFSISNMEHKSKVDFLNYYYFFYHFQSQELIAEREVQPWQSGPCREGFLLV